MQEDVNEEANWNFRGENLLGAEWRREDFASKNTFFGCILYPGKGVYLAYQILILLSAVACVVYGLDD